MAEQSICSNIFQSTFSSWFGKNFSFYNWISSSNNLDSLLTLGHGCMTPKDSFHLSLYKQWWENQRTVMTLVENGQFNCLCHTSMCQLVSHHKAGCRMDYLKTRVLDWQSRFKSWHMSWIITYFCIWWLYGSKFSPQNVAVGTISC